MDRDTLIGIVEKKHHFRVDPNDPVFVLATISEAIQQEAQGELRKIVADAIDRTAEANRQAEAAAQVRVEAIVRDAGESAAEQIRQAAAKILMEAQKTSVDAERIRRSAMSLLVCSLAVLLASIIAMVKIGAG
jgi:hypothetical protein